MADITSQLTVDKLQIKGGFRMVVQNYLENEVMNASSLKLVVMLYDGGIRFLRRLDGLDYSKNIEIKNDNIKKTLAILSELQITLDMSYAAVAEPLFSLYSYMQRRLMESTVNNNPEGVAEVIRLLAELRDTWVAINEKELADQTADVNKILSTVEPQNTENAEYTPFSLVG